MTNGAALVGTKAIALAVSHTMKMPTMSTKVVKAAGGSVSPVHMLKFRHSTRSALSMESHSM